MQSEVRLSYAYVRQKSTTDPVGRQSYQVVYDCEIHWIIYAADGLHHWLHLGVQAERGQCRSLGAIGGSRTNFAFLSRDASFEI